MSDISKMTLEEVKKEIKNAKAQLKELDIKEDLLKKVKMFEVGEFKGINGEEVSIKKITKCYVMGIYKIYKDECQYLIEDTSKYKQWIYKCKINGYYIDVGNIQTGFLSRIYAKDLTKI